MRIKVLLDGVVAGSSARLQTTIDDYDDTAIPVSQLTSVTLNLYDKSTGTQIGDADRDVLSEVSAAGVLTYIVPATENVLLTSSGRTTPETHVIDIVAVGTSGDGNVITISQQIHFDVIPKVGD